jgi:hypothetical protein
MVTVNTTMMAALSDPITASGTNSLRYSIATPRVCVRSPMNIGYAVWFSGTTEKFCCENNKVPLWQDELPPHRCAATNGRGVGNSVAASGSVRIRSPAGAA